MTQHAQPEPTGTVISAGDQRDLRVGMNALPYAADLRVPIPPRGELSARDVVALLDGLRQVLTEVAERADDSTGACSPWSPTWRRSAASSAPHSPR